MFQLKYITLYIGKFVFSHTLFVALNNEIRVKMQMKKVRGA